MKRLSYLLCLTLMVASNVSAGLVGSEATARNTIQVDEPLASNFGIPANTEVDFVPETSPFAVVAGASPELVGFATVYDINFNDSSVDFTFNPTPDSQVPPRVLEAGTFDRYYFNFTFPDASRISAVAFDPGNSNIVPDATASPTATLLSDSSFMVEIGPGNGVLPGFAHSYNVTVVPEPATAALLLVAGLGLLPFRRE